MFVDACTDKESNPNDFATLARVMYRSLVAPLEPEITDKSELILETDAFLTLVPFEALLSPKGEYIGERFAIAYSPGLLYGSGERRDSAVGVKSRLLVVGAPSLDSGTDLTPLADSEDEAREISALFENHRVYTRQEGTGGNIRKELPVSEIFHFAGHAVIRNGITRLALADTQGAKNGWFRSDKPIRCKHTPERTPCRIVGLFDDERLAGRPRRPRQHGQDALGRQCPSSGGEPVDC